MRTVGIIQARMESERLPGKVLEPIGPRTVLGWVHYRTSQIKLDEIVVATTDRPADDEIVERCEFLGFECFRGSADDVLDRYYQAAKKYRATHILRVTADCPLLDHVLNQRILDHLIEEPSVDYVASRGWPDGVGQEAFTYDALQWTWRRATEPTDREHVITYMIRHLQCGYLDRRKLSVDTEDDLVFLRNLHAREPEQFQDVSFS